MEIYRFFRFTKKINNDVRTDVVRTKYCNTSTTRTTTTTTNNSVSPKSVNTLAACLYQGYLSFQILDNYSATCK